MSLLNGSSSSEHGARLSESLHKLQLAEVTDSELDSATNGDHPESSRKDSPSPGRVTWNPHVREGYGFRSASGVSTPLIASTSAQGTGSPLPDPNGLGWPGQSASLRRASSNLNASLAAKSTVSRLNATPAERAAREQKLAAAVRTILECIGEDPDREGLVKTPERYSQALMWMTRGYEERLAGMH